MGLFDRRLPDGEDDATGDFGPAPALVDQVAAYSEARASDDLAGTRERRFERQHGVDHGDIAEHIRSILNAAEQAAEQIRQAATEEAARMLEDARTAKLDAERAREQVEEDRAKTYQAAEAVAAQIRVAAEQEAEEIVQQAQDDATRVGADAEERRAGLLDECRAAEDRLREILQTTQQLSALLERRLPTAAPE